jgi:hypothetical protein
LLSACAQGLAHEEVPALIDHPTSESRAELAKVVSTALNGAPITLADDALTRDSVLIIERVQRRDAQGLPLNGRELERPEQFRLLKSGRRCVLVHERTGKRWPLRSTTCRASR